MWVLLLMLVMVIGCLWVARKLFTTTPTVQPSTTTPIGQLSTTAPTGQLSTTPPTGQLSTTQATGQPSTTPPTGQLSTTQATGQLSTTQATGQPATPDSTRAFKQLVGWDHSGDDLYVLKGLAQPDCNAACASTSSCHMYVVDIAGGLCYLKTLPGDRTRPMLQKKSGLDAWLASNMTLPWSARPGFDNGGDELQALDVDPLTCGYTCGATAGCQFYVTDTSGTKCWLKKSVGYDTSDPGRQTWAAPGQKFAPIVEMWTQANYKGYYKSLLQPGDYNDFPIKFPASLFQIKLVTSLKVPPGFRVKFWQNKDYSGKSYELAAGVYPDLNLQGIHIGDVLSLQCYAV